MSNDARTGATCVAPSLAAAIADGEIGRAARDEALAHADHCEDCRRLLAAVSLAAAADDRRDPGLAVPEQTRYVPAGEIGRGALGRVVEAHDRRLGRTVALKLLAAHWPGTKARFLREVRITARLQHPAIVPIYDAGEDDAGEPYYAMRMVAGNTLADAIAAAERFEDRLALVPHVLTAAEAVAHAHARSIVHRDLKPANVLVAELGETVVIDWGLAKDLRAEHEDLSGHVGDDEGISRAGILIMGTPAYMAPEQARGEPVDPRSDVWALGGILYAVMSGRPPIAGDSATAMIQRAAVAAPTPLAELAPNTPPELAAIVGKAMAPAPGDRYPSARELALDLRRFTTGQLVAAASYSPLQLARRWLGSHRAAVLAAGAIGVAAIAGGAVGVVRAVASGADAEARLTASEARRVEGEAHGASLLLANARSAVDRDPTESLAWLKQYAGTDWQYASALAAEAVTRGAAEHVFRFDRPVSSIALSHDGTVLAVGLPTEVAWIDVRRGRAIGEQPIAGAHAIVLAGGAWVVARGDGSLIVTSGPGREPRFERIELFASPARAVSVSGDGDAVCAAGPDGKVFRMVVATAQVALVSRHDGPAADCAFDSAGRVWSVGVDRTLRGGATDASPAVALRAASPLERLGFDEADELLVAGTDGTVYARRDGRLDAVRQLAPGGASRAWRHVRLSRGAASFRPASATVHAWNGAVLEHPAPIRVVASETRLYELISGDANGTIYLWRDGGMHTLVGHRGGLVALALARDGRTLASVSANRELRLWTLGTVRSAVLGGPGSGLLHLAVGSDTVYATARSGKVVRWDDNAPTAVALAGFEGAATGVAVDRAGRRAAASSADGALTSWNWGDRAWSEQLDAGLNAVALSSDGKLVITAGDDGRVRLWAADSGAALAHADTGAPVNEVELDASGAWIVSLGDEPALRVWRVAPTGRALEPLAKLPHVGAHLSAPRFAAQSRTVLAAGADGAIRQWSLTAPSEAPRILARHEGAASALAVSAQGDHAASGGADGEVWLMELAPDADPATATRLRGHRAGVRAVAFAPDGSLLASASADGQIRLWGPDGAWSAVLGAHRGPVHAIGFDPRARLYSAGEDGVVHAWRQIAASRAPATSALTEWITRKTTAEIDRAGNPASSWQVQPSDAP